MKKFLATLIWFLMSPFAIILMSLNALREELDENT